MYNTYLVARSLDNGAVVWTQNMTDATGPSKLPVSPPTVNLGVVSLVTAQGLGVLDGGSGQMRYTVEEGELWGCGAAPACLPPASVLPQGGGGRRLVRCWLGWGC